MSFQYPDARADVISSVNFTTHAGQMLGIIGSTGSGKSTLVQLIPRLYDVTGGSISLDGVDVRDMTLSELRRRIGYIPQQGRLFSGTVESNLKFAGDMVSDDDMRQAARISQAEDFIAEREGGYDSPISRGGSNVSGGQRQRLAIARALAKKPEVVVSMIRLAPSTTRPTRACAKSLPKNVTDAALVVVAQRIATIMHADQIIVLDDGHVVGTGTHEAAAQLPGVPGDRTVAAFRRGAGAYPRRNCSRHGRRRALMADETKTQIPKPTRQRGPMGRMGGMRRGEKAKDFKGTMKQLLGYIGQHKIAVFAAVAFAVCSVIFNIVGPKVLGQVTTKLFEGLVAKVNGTGDVDFDWIAKTLGFLLCLYLASSVCSLVRGWLMTGVTQKICYRMRKEIAAKIAVVPMSYFNGHSKGDVLSRITNDVDTLGQSLNQSVTQLITSVTQIIGVLIMMLSISLPLTGVTVLTLPAAAIILTVMIHFSQPYFREQQQVLGAVNGIIEEDFAGQNVIQVFDRAEASIEEFDRQNDRLFISGWRSQFLSGLMMPLMSPGG